MMLAYLLSAWQWITALCSLERLTREMRSLPYRGQPIRFHPKRGLYIVKRTSLRERRDPAQAAAEAAWRRQQWQTRHQ